MANHTVRVKKRYNLQEGIGPGYQDIMVLETYLNLQPFADLSGSQKQIRALRRLTVLTRKNLRAPPRASFFAADMQKATYRAFTCAGIKEIVKQGDSE